MGDLNLVKTTSEKQMRLNEPLSFACYYGPARLRDLASYNLVLVEPAYYAPAQVAQLRARDVQAIAYLSIGYEPAPGVGERWHVTDPSTGLPVRDPRWDTLLVDCRSPVWQDHVVCQRIPDILARGFQGLLLDNLDVQERYADTRPGVISLIQRIRRAHPDLILVANRGFSILDALVTSVDTVLFEAFTTYHDGKSYAAWKGADLAWTEIQARRIRSLNCAWPVLALDYAAPQDAELRCLAAARASAHGFISFVSTWALDWLPDAAPSTPRSVG